MRSRLPNFHTNKAERTSLLADLVLCFMATNICNANFGIASTATEDVRSHFRTLRTALAFKSMESDREQQASKVA